MTPDQANALTVAVADWVNARPDLTGLAICGSWARGDPRPDSDLDLIVLCRQPDALVDPSFLSAINFAAAGFHSVSVQRATYGAVWSWHVQLLPPGDLELTIVPPKWAATAPVDEGTRGIVADVFQPIIDKERLLLELIAALPKKPFAVFQHKDAKAFRGVDEEPHRVFVIKTQRRWQVAPLLIDEPVTVVATYARWAEVFETETHETDRRQGDGSERPARRGKCFLP